MDDQVIANSKEFFRSKTFWVNVIAAIALVVQANWGFVFGAELQAIALSLVNLGLRSVTKEAITF